MKDTQAIYYIKHLKDGLEPFTAIGVAGEVIHSIRREIRVLEEGLQIQATFEDGSRVILIVAVPCEPTGGRGGT